MLQQFTKVNRHNLRPFLLRYKIDSREERCVTRHRTAAREIIKSIAYSIKKKHKTSINRTIEFG